MKVALIDFTQYLGVEDILYEEINQVISLNDELRFLVLLGVPRDATNRLAHEIGERGISYIAAHEAPVSKSELNGIIGILSSMASAPVELLRFELGSAYQEYQPDQFQISAINTTINNILAIEKRQIIQYDKEKIIPNKLHRFLEEFRFGRHLLREIESFLQAKQLEHEIFNIDNAKPKKKLIDMQSLKGINFVEDICTKTNLRRVSENSYLTDQFLSRFLRLGEDLIKARSQRIIKIRDILIWWSFYFLRSSVAAENNKLVSFSALFTLRALECWAIRYLIDVNAVDITGDYCVSIKHKSSPLGGAGSIVYELVNQLTLQGYNDKLSLELILIKQLLPCRNNSVCGHGFANLGQKEVCEFRGAVSRIINICEGCGPSISPVWNELRTASTGNKINEEQLFYEKILSVYDYAIVQ